MNTSNGLKADIIDDVDNLIGEQSSPIIRDDMKMTNNISCINTNNIFEIGFSPLRKKNKPCSSHFESKENDIDHIGNQITHNDSINENNNSLTTTRKLKNRGGKNRFKNRRNHQCDTEEIVIGIHNLCSLNESQKNGLETEEEAVNITDKTNENE